MASIVNMFVLKLSVSVPLVPSRSQVFWREYSQKEWKFKWPQVSIFLTYKHDEIDPHIQFQDNSEMA